MKRRMLKRIRKWLGITFILILAVFFAVLAFIRFLLPTDKVRNALCDQVSKAVGSPFEIKHLSVNPFGRVDLDSVLLDWHAPSGPLKSTKVEAKKVHVRFKLFPLLRKRFEVADISVANPKIGLSMIADTAKAEAAKPMQPMPMSIQIGKVALSNLAFQFTLEDTSGNTRVAIDHVYFESDGISMARGDSTLGTLSGNLRFGIRDGALDLDTPQGNFAFMVGTEWEAGLNQGDWRVNGSLGVSPSGGGPDIRASLGLSGERLERATLDSLDLVLFNQPALRLTGSAENLGPDMTFRASLSGYPLEISRLWTDVQKLPIEIPPEALGIRIRGLLAPITGTADGSVRRVRFNLSSGLDGVTVSDSVSRTEARGASGQINASGEWTGPIHVSANGSVAAAKVLSSLPDGTKISVDSVAVRFESIIDADLAARRFYRLDAKISGKADSVFGGKVGLELDLKSGRRYVGDPLDATATGTISADSIAIERFPNAAPGVWGLLFAECSLSGRRLDSIGVKLDVSSPGIAYPMEKGSEVTPPLKVASTLALGASRDFTVWSISGGRVRLNDILRGTLSGSFRADGRFRFMADAEADNSKLYRYFPKSVKKTMPGLVLGGHENVHVEFSGKPAGDSSDVQMNGKVALHEILFDDPVNVIRIEGGEGETVFFGPPTGISGTGGVFVSRITLPTLSIPIDSSTAYFDWTVSAARLDLANGTIHAPSLSAGGTWRFGLDFGPPPGMSGQADFKFLSKESLAFLPDLAASGSASATVFIETVDREKQRLRISGTVSADSMRLSGALFAVNGASGILPFGLDIDIPAAKLAPDTSYHPFQWTDFESNPELYRRFRPDDGMLRIASVEAAGYRIENIECEAVVGHGLIEIPRFAATLMEGRVAGSAIIRLNGGLPQEIEYELRAQASRIDASSLIKDRKRETESELDATADFHGRGLDPKKGIELEGAFHITQIGPKFASMLLLGMDPKQEDRSIGMTRKLLNAGWKPKLFSFELRHGYVYPSLELSQPWFSPIRIPGRLEYGRLPLDFLLTQAPMPKR